MPSDNGMQRTVMDGVPLQIGQRPAADAGR